MALAELVSGTVLAALTGRSACGPFTGTCSTTTGRPPRCCKAARPGRRVSPTP
jgi:hypothetical protein